PQSLRSSPAGARSMLAPSSADRARSSIAPWATDATVRDVVLSADAFAAEHEWAGDAHVRDVLFGLGLGAIGLDSPVATMSGGERRRVSLASHLVHKTDLLVLDEPTNHLDVEAVTWLAAHLLTRKGGLVLVTHDRWLLDAVCTRTWEVADGSVHDHDGGYADYVLARAERERLEAAGEQRRQNLVRKELARLRRGPPARTSKPRFRVEAAQALIADVPPPRDSLALKGFASRRLGKSVYDVEDVTVRVGERSLLAGATWRIGPGDRIGVVGVNGSGKTTLLRLLTDERAPDSGRVRVGTTVAPGYLSQEVGELPDGLRVLQAVEEIGRVVHFGGIELGASTIAERFGFDARRQWTPVADLSGGERRRLQLLRLLMAEPNVLLLDEPTNDLDTDTLAALEDLLDGWPGSLIVVSHDRYLLERVCDSVVALLCDGGISALPGGVEEYLQRRSTGGAEATRAEASQTGGTATGTAGTAAKRPIRSADTRAARKELARLERRLQSLARKESTLHDDLAANATEADRVLKLDHQLRALLAERARLEDQWLELAEEAQ
ncbi:MAG: ABC-F family ATP-binding cassette domain-containing protein, partial [Mycobacteriales bacterium]